MTIRRMGLRVRAMNSDLRKILYRKFEETYPELLFAALADKQVCLDLVRRMDDPGRFALALFVLEYYWPVDAAVIERCQQLIGDRMAHENFRAPAMTYLAGAQAGTKDPTTIAALIAIVRDELNTEEMRLAAYYTFLRIIDHSSSLFALLFYPISWLVPNSTRNINWRLIRKWSHNP
jgi:hypothetical protein